MNKLTKKVSNKNTELNALSFREILAIIFISLLIISLVVSIFYEFKNNSSDSQKELTNTQNQETTPSTTSPTTTNPPENQEVEYDCNYVWYQQIVDKTTREILWICTLDRPYCKAGTTQCCKWTQTTRHYDCQEMK
ncbi:MAG: hypothetical protein ABIH72_01105 [archaeon]